MIHESLHDLPAETDKLEVLIETCTQNGSIPTSNDFMKAIDVDKLDESCGKKGGTIKSNGIKRKQKLGQFLELGIKSDCLKESNEFETADIKKSTPAEKSVSKMATFQGSTTDMETGHSSHPGQARKRNTVDNLNADSTNETGTERPHPRRWFRARHAPAPAGPAR